MIVSLLALTGAVIGLVWAADRAVGSAGAIADRLGVSPRGGGGARPRAGTSLPEIGTNIAAGLSSLRGVDASGIAVGSIVGSNLSQITLLLGVAGLVAMLRLPERSLKRDGAMVVVALVAMFLVCLDGTAGRAEGGFLVAAYAVYIVVVVLSERRQAPPGSGPAGVRVGRATGFHVAILLVALLAVVACSEVIASQGVEVARVLGLSETVIGLFVGLTTSLPELAVSVRALHSGDRALSLGNLLGSNVTDPLASFGLGALVHPVQVDATVLRFDFPWWAVGTGVALLLLSNDRNLDRRESIVLITLFVLFVWLRLSFHAV